MKDVGLRIRLQKELREQFLAACKARDKPAAQVLREFMRGYVAPKNVEAGAVIAQAPAKRAKKGQRDG